jgi:hypothetical protein
MTEKHPIKNVTASSNRLVKARMTGTKAGFCPEIDAMTGFLNIFEYTGIVFVFKAL